MFLVTSLVPLAASATLRTISWVAAPCSSTAAAIEAATPLISRMRTTIPLIAATRLTRRALDAGDVPGDLLGSARSLVGEILDFDGYHGEAAARIARPRGLDRRVQGQQIRLRGDVRDQADGLTDLG